MIELQDVVSSFSTCGGLTDSQNFTPKHSTITATIDSQSSLYGTGMYMVISTFIHHVMLLLALKV